MQCLSRERDRQTNRQNKGGQVATGEGWTQKGKVRSDITPKRRNDSKQTQKAFSFEKVSLLLNKIK